MKNHLKDYKKLNQSNPLEIVSCIKKPIKKVKSNLDHYFKIIYNNYIKFSLYILIYFLYLL